MSGMFSKPEMPAPPPPTLMPDPKGFISKAKRKAATIRQQQRGGREETKLSEKFGG